VMTADLGGSLRCGTTALRLALDTVRAGSAAQALVTAADMRPAAPGTAEELQLGDGAAAAIVGSDDVIATYEGGYTASREFSDVWRVQGDRYLNVLPDMTFVKGYGLDRHIPEAVEGALRGTGRKREDIAKLVLYAPDARTHATLVRQLKFPDSAMPREPVIGRAGNTGSASGLLGLAAALEECKPGDQILVVSYGSGAEALLFQCTDRLVRASIHRPVSAQLTAGRPLAHYGKLLNFRRHVETEVIRAFTSVPTMVREEKQDLRLYGQKCADCGAVSYPRRQLCWQCSSKNLVDHKISRHGSVFTFTKDHLVPNPDPPTVMVSADLEGGGRFYGQLTDCDPAAVDFAMPVELCFRRIHEGEGLINYFWKFRPVMDAS
jgi:hydroxymethylglutaryl-CoA synthase